MDRRGFLLTSLAVAVGGPLAADAQQGRKVARVGILSSGYLSTGPLQPTSRAFEEGLRDLGWTVGRDVVLERRYAEGDLDRLPALAHELVRLNVDVIAAFGPLTIRPARDATQTIPVVMIAVGDPVAQGLVTSLARPEANITGVAWGTGAENLGKILETLREAIPRATRVALLGEGSRTLGDRDFEDTARRLGLGFALFSVKDLSELEPAMDAISRQGFHVVSCLCARFCMPNAIASQHSLLPDDWLCLAASASCRRREVPSAMGFVFATSSVAPRPTWIESSKVPSRATSRSSRRRGSSSSSTL
jgi:putative tryptophan/tyrosine transport system substrate-binding protein